MKAITMPLRTNTEQRKILNEWFNTSNYVYNKALYEIKENKAQPNFINLRNLLVTAETKMKDILYKETNDAIKLLKKQQKIPETNQEELNEQIKKQRDILKTIKKETNGGVLSWELNTPKEIRASAVKDVCLAYKTAITNLKRKNIRFFNFKYIKKEDNKKSFTIAHNTVKNNDGIIEIFKTFSKNALKFNMGKRSKLKHCSVNIEHDCRFYRKNGKYYISIPIKKENKKPELNKTNLNYSGVDPGVRTFMTSFGNIGCFEYEHRYKLLKKLKKKKDNMKKRIKEQKQNTQKEKTVCDAEEKGRKKVTKRNFVRLENKLKNHTEELHWKTVHDLLKKNDVLFYGDFKSHEIVRKGKNWVLNTDVNQLKFYQFKMRLIEKAKELGKTVIPTKEHFTTKVCSFCGSLNDPGKSKIYTCRECSIIVGRDVNAAKNILLKGIIEHH